MNANLLRHHDPRYFVVEKIGLSTAQQRPDTGEDGHTKILRAFRHFVEDPHSKTGCVITYCAPAATFRSSREICDAMFFEFGLKVQPTTNCVALLNRFARVVKSLVHPLGDRDSWTELTS